MSEFQKKLGFAFTLLAVDGFITREFLLGNYDVHTLLVAWKVVGRSNMDGHYLASDELLGMLEPYRSFIAVFRQYRADYEKVLNMVNDPTTPDLEKRRMEFAQIKGDEFLRYLSNQIGGRLMAEWQWRVARKTWEQSELKLPEFSLPDLLTCPHCGFTGVFLSGHKCDPYAPLLGVWL